MLQRFRGFLYAALLTGAAMVLPVLFGGLVLWHDPGTTTDLKTIWAVVCVASVVFVLLMLLFKEAGYWWLEIALLIPVGVPIISGMALPFVATWSAIAGTCAVIGANIVFAMPAGFLVMIAWQVILPHQGYRRLEITSITGNPDVIPRGD